MTTPSDKRVRYVIAVIVAFVWGFNVMAGAFIPEYEESHLVNTVMLAVVGGLFGAGVLSARNGGGKDDPK